MLKGKRILLAVTGGIAIYKACDIVSRLKKLGADVKVIMTKHATEFVSPLTFQSMSLNYVVTDMFEEPKSWDVEHITLAQWADLCLVAPATANVIGKLYQGIADDMVSTVLMATKAPIMIAPAMNTGMYTNPVVQRNIKGLSELGYLFVEPASGRLACGDLGLGKLQDPAIIVERVKHELLKGESLKGMKAVVTAGPTQEAIDPFRYITNHSSGKMGYALAEALYYRGADVTLVTGPTHLEAPQGVEVVAVTSTNDMFEELMKREASDIIIKAAAVSDYGPEVVEQEKIKKSGDMSLSLVRRPDILKTLGEKKLAKVLVGFAAETSTPLEYGKSKLEKKNADMMIVNDISKKGAGFKSDTNQVVILTKNNEAESIPMMPKRELADEIINRIEKLLTEE